MSVIAYTHPKFRCAMCGNRLAACESQYERHTKLHFCIDTAACKARGKVAA